MSKRIKVRHANGEEYKFKTMADLERVGLLNRGFEIVDAPEDAAISDEGTADYEAMTVEDMKPIAKAKGITGYSSMNRDELVAALKKADA